MQRRGFSRRLASERTRFCAHVQACFRAVHTRETGCVRERERERMGDTREEKERPGEGDEGGGASGKVRSVGSPYTYTHRDITRRS